VLVDFDVAAVDTEALTRALNAGRAEQLGPDELVYKRRGLAAVKQRALSGLEGVEVIRSYDNLGSSFVRVATEQALAGLLARPEVKAVHENVALQHFLAESLPLISQPAVASAGVGGAGTTVAVLDTGVDYTIAPFNCTSPGTPSGCRVVATLEAAPDDFSLDASGHGTNVSAIVASVAPQTSLAVADVFSDPRHSSPTFKKE
jgi:subtilisin family serine protease